MTTPSFLAKTLWVSAAGALSLHWSAAVLAASPSNEELHAIIKQQGAQIDALTRGQAATADAIEKGGVSGLPAWLEKTTLGGYGEMHYNNLTADGADGDGVTKDKDELDLHRFVLFVGHQFSDSVRFFSELEVEHSLAGESKNGEVEIEQAFVEWDVRGNTSAKAGLFLLPVGILNETHEPDTFYGVERNNVEKNIIPTTWWEGGVGVSGEIVAGLSYDVAAHSGLYIDVNDGDFKVRGGRQKVSEAEAQGFAYTGRIKYTGVPGLELAATVQHQEDVSQGDFRKAIDADLYEAHAVFQKGMFGLRALYAMWNIDGAISAVTGKAGADEQEGFYVEPSLKVCEDIGIFARYSEWDNQAGDSSVDSEFEQVDVGVNYWLSETVVLKADYQNQSHEDDSKAFDGFNLGVGWSF